MKLFETSKHQHTATETVNIFKKQSPGHYKVFLHSTPDDFFWKLLAAKFGGRHGPWLPKIRLWLFFAKVQKLSRNNMLY